MDMPFGIQIQPEGIYPAVEVGDIGYIREGSSTISSMSYLLRNIRPTATSVSQSTTNS